jgi:hypothetical protein
MPCPAWGQAITDGTDRGQTGDRQPKLGRANLLAYFGAYCGVVPLGAAWQSRLGRSRFQSPGMGLGVVRAFLGALALPEPV